MNTKIFKTLMILLPVIFIILLTALIITHISYNRARRQMSEPSIVRMRDDGTPSTNNAMTLRNGDVLYIRTSGTHTIYVESRFPPQPFIHSFTLTNIYTNDVIYSVPSFDYTYSELEIFGGRFGGRFGERLATVNLESGIYLLEFEPIEYGGDLVWNAAERWNELNTSFRFGNLILIFSFTLSLVFTAFIIIIAIHIYLQHQNDKRKRRYLQMNNPHNMRKF
ncbi:MAG: hypothetical protein FWE05_13335 [Defluviitaleaceae bacterium]|nr:hypothetical protein [Defluviitaleaceae bacterium]